MSYRVIIDNIDREEWEREADNFADYSIYQTWPYQQVRSEIDGQQLSRVVIRDEDNKVVTMCQIRIKHVKPLGLRIGYAQWGPLFRNKSGKVICSIEALRELRKAYVGNIVNVLRVVPNAGTDESDPTFTEMLRAAGFDCVQSIEPYRTFVLPVDDSEEEIRKRLRKSFRRDLKKAEQSKIEITEGKDKDFCDILENLYKVLLERKKFKGLNPREFTRTQAMLSPCEKMNIIVVHFHGEPVAAHLASNLGDTAVVLLAATNELGLACGSSYLIWYKGAVAAGLAGMKLYDLGGVDPDNNPNVYKFKSRMGGKESFHIGAFEAYGSISAKTTWRMAEKIYRMVKS